MASPIHVWIHADESCLGNQFQHRANPGGAAGLVETWHEGAWARRDYWSSSPDTTNNRMALRSAIDGLRYLTRPCRVTFVSDSQYLIKGMTEWMPGWKARGWRRKAGPIENLELWKEADRIAARHQVRWQWVRGHAGHPRNEYANDLAVRAAEEGTASSGLEPSEFEAWLQQQREGRDRYWDFNEHAPPEQMEA